MSLEGLADTKMDLTDNKPTLFAKNDKHSAFRTVRVDVSRLCEQPHGKTPASGPATAVDELERKMRARVLQKAASLASAASANASLPLGPSKPATLPDQAPAEPVMLPSSHNALLADMARLRHERAMRRAPTTTHIESTTSTTTTTTSTHTVTSSSTPGRPIARQTMAAPAYMYPNGDVAAAARHHAANLAAAAKHAAKMAADADAVHRDAYNVLVSALPASAPYVDGKVAAVYPRAEQSMRRLMRDWDAAAAGPSGAAAWATEPSGVYTRKQQRQSRRDGDNSANEDVIDYDNDKCVCCRELKTPETSNHWVLKNCSHSFHKKCMCAWAQHSCRRKAQVTCPLCRVPSPRPPPETSENKRPVLSQQKVLSWTVTSSGRHSRHTNTNPMYDPEPWHNKRSRYADDIVGDDEKYRDDEESDASSSTEPDDESDEDYVVPA